MQEKLDKRFVIATYSDLTAAQKVVQNLLRGGFERDDIRLYRKPKASQSADPSPGEMMGEHRALVRVEATANRVEPATEIINSQPPTLVEVAGENWHDEEWAQMIPDLKSYQALGFDFGDVREEISEEEEA